MKQFLKDFSLARLATMFLLAVIVVARGPWAEWAEAEAWRTPILVAILAGFGTAVWRWKDKKTAASNDVE